ncbi:hypothetical protein C9926_00575 [Sulfurovum lithotrophicum]|nr:hypothetical protein C9926_00575 [Sulfurovum lithotrophicum]
MNIKIIGLIGIILVLFSFTKCTNKNTTSSSFVEASTTDMIHSIERENKFTRWLSSKEYQSRFKNKSNFYKKHKIYPAYIEMDTLGNRRVIDIEYEPRFHWRCTSARSKDEFKKIHIKETLNRGKRLLSLSILNKDGIDIYAGTWVSKDVFERESKKLKKYGISPPFFKD